MNTQTEIAVVLPAHNEELLLANTVRSVIEELERRELAGEVIVVENGSTDQTSAIAERIANEHPRVRVLSYPFGDYGEALYRGICAAHASYVATFDVDLFDFTFFDLALEDLRNGRSDIVIASKRAKGAKDRRPPIRRLLTFGFTTLLRILVGLRVSDAHGMKILKKQTVTSIVDSCVMRGSLFDVELVVRAMRNGLQVSEIPVTVRELRPPRTGIARRSAESLRGAIRLREILRDESSG